MTETLPIGTSLTEDAFRALVAKNGMKLEGAALQAALKEARRLLDQIARLDAYLAETEACREPS